MKKNFFLSQKNCVYMIAEVGSAHEGSYAAAKKIIHQACQSNTDAIKFQIYKSSTLTSKKFTRDRYEHFLKLELNIEQYKNLIKICRKNNKNVGASIWDRDLIKTFSSLVDFYKIGSGDFTNFEIINEILMTSKPLIISTGLSSVKDIREMISFIKKKNPDYLTKKKLAFLHCNASYPTPLSDCNLGSIEFLKKKLSLTIGYSDHTIGDFAVIGAFFSGAKIIEKHFSNDPQKKTFRDNEISFDRYALDNFLNKINQHKNMLSIKKTKTTKSEKNQNTLSSARRSVYAKKELKKGQKISSKDIMNLRPKIGICSSHFLNLIGKKINKSKKKNDPIFFRDISDE